MYGARVFGDISTHAPRTGSDDNWIPVSERLPEFQPTLPARGATPRPGAAAPAGGISTHAPRTGSDNTVEWWEACCKDFNPRSPHGERHLSMANNERIDRFQPTLPARGATIVSKSSRAPLGISTHAPRTGSDGASPQRPPPSCHFNPRSPHGERPKSSASARRAPDFNPRSPHGERLLRRRLLHR